MSEDDQQCWQTILIVFSRKKTCGKRDEIQFLLLQPSNTTQNYGSRMKTVKYITDAIPQLCNFFHLSQNVKQMSAQKYLKLR